MKRETSVTWTSRHEVKWPEACVTPATWKETDLRPQRRHLEEDCAKTDMLSNLWLGTRLRRRPSGHMI